MAELEDRDERHVQALADSLRKALVAGAPDEGIEQLTRAAMGDDSSAPQSSLPPERQESMADAADEPADDEVERA